MSKTIETAVDLKNFQAELESFKKESGRGLLKNLENTHCVVVRDDGTPIRDKSLINDYLNEARKGTCTAYLSPGPGMPLAKFSKTFQGYIKPEDLAADTLGTSNGEVQNLRERAQRAEALREAIPPKPSGATRFFSSLLRVVTLGIFGGFQSVKDYDAATAAYNAAKLSDAEKNLPGKLENRQSVVNKAMNSVNRQHADNVREFGSYTGPIPEDLQVEQQVEKEKTILPASKATKAKDHYAANMDIFVHLKESISKEHPSHLLAGTQIVNLYQNNLNAAAQKKTLLSDDDINTLYVIRDMNPLALQALCANLDLQKEDDDSEITMDMVHKAVNETYNIYKNTSNYEDFRAKKNEKGPRESVNNAQLGDGGVQLNTH